MNWNAVWQYVIGGAIVSWPGVIAGFWMTWRKTRNHVDARTEQQNELIERLTADQTAALLAARNRHPGPGQSYHGHGEDS